MSKFALIRLIEERTEWRHDPLNGFSARPTKLIDGSPDYLTWRCIVPGKEGTPWNHALYKVKLIFDIHYPASVPKVRFDHHIIHPNVNRLGYMTLSHFSPDRPSTSINIKKILWAVQQLMAHPNMSDLTMEEADYWASIDADIYHDAVALQAVLIAKSDPSLANNKPQEEKTTPKKKLDQKSKSKCVFPKKIKITNC